MKRLVALAWFLLAASAQAAGFDCDKAATQVEKLICGDAKLSKADEELAAAYSQILKEASNPAIIKKQQREWLADVRNHCNDAECLKEAYSARMAQLVPSPKGAIQNPASTSPVVVRTIHNDNYSLPFVVMAPPEVGRRINDQVWNNTVEIPAPATFEEAQEAILHLPPHGRSLVSAKYSVDRNDGRILVLIVDGEGCGAYCSSTGLAFIFDIRTGNTVHTADMVTSEGKSVLAKRMKAKFIKRVEAIVAKLRNDPSETDQDSLSMYEQCLKEWKEWQATNMLSIDMNGGAQLSPGNCSNHAMRPYDALDNLYEGVTPSEVKPYLSAYGRSLLLNEGDVRDLAPPENR